MPSCGRAAEADLPSLEVPVECHQAERARRALHNPHRTVPRRPPCAPDTVADPHRAWFAAKLEERGELVGETQSGSAETCSISCSGGQTWPRGYVSGSAGERAALRRRPGTERPRRRAPAGSAGGTVCLRIAGPVGAVERHRPPETMPRGQRDPHRPACGVEKPAAKRQLASHPSLIPRVLKASCFQGPSTAPASAAGCSTRCRCARSSLVASLAASQDG